MCRRGIFLLCFVIAGQALGVQVQIVPQHPTIRDVVAITVSGWWGNSCVPNVSTVSVEDNNIYFEVSLDYPPDIYCAAVLTPWELIEYVGPLSPGTYTIYVSCPCDPNYIVTNFAVRALEGKAAIPIPDDNAKDVPPDVVLSWLPVAYATSHDVYIGTDLEDVNDANSTDHPNVTYDNVDVNSYDPNGLVLGTTYYWRIDEVNDANGDRWKGEVWSFTTIEYIIVDDFEVYDESSLTDDPCLVYIPSTQEDGVWRDAWSYTTWPRPLAYLDPNYSILRGTQSLEFKYNNNLGGPGMCKGYSEAWRPYEADLLNIGAKALSVWFHGSSGNDEEKMYAALKDTEGHIGAVFYPNEPNDANLKNPDYYQGKKDVKKEDWHEWHIKLEDFTYPQQPPANDVNLASISKFYLGFGDRENPVLQGSGMFSVVYFDDIRVYISRCVAEYGPKADLNGDCIVDLEDLKVMAEEEWLWLRPPSYPELVLHYEFEEKLPITFAHDSSGNGYDGVAKVQDGNLTEAFWGTGGICGGCIRFQKQIKAYCVEAPNDAFNNHITSKIAICVWVNWDWELYGEMPDETNQLFSMHGGPGAVYDGILGIETDYLGDQEIRFWDASASAVYSVGVEDWSGAWNHYVFVKDVNEGYLRIYHNGLQVAETNSNEPINLPVDLARIGLATDSWHDEYTGLLDDFRIYDDDPPPLIGPCIVVPPCPPYPRSDLNYDCSVDFKDYAILVYSWLDEKWFPEEP